MREEEEGTALLALAEHAICRATGLAVPEKRPGVSHRMAPKARPIVNCRDIWGDLSANPACRFRHR